MTYPSTFHVLALCITVVTAHKSLTVETANKSFFSYLVINLVFNTKMVILNLIQLNGLQQCLTHVGSSSCSRQAVAEDFPPAYLQKYKMVCLFGHSTVYEINYFTF